MSPRPILKSPPSPTLTSTSPLPFPFARIPMLDSPCVHFPPTPTLTQIEITHSSFNYDRKPIVVLPNACALPGRGERALDSLADSEYDFCCKKRRTKAGYFHPKAYEAVAYEGDTDQFESSSSLLSMQDGSSLSHSSSYRLRNDVQNDRRSYSRFGSVAPPLVLETSECPESSGDGSISEYLNSDMDPCQFQHFPCKDISLPFQNNCARIKSHLEDAGADAPSIPRKKSKSRIRTSNISNLERTRRAVASNVACGGFSSGFYDPSLEGCLGGFWTIYVMSVFNF